MTSVLPGVDLRRPLDDAELRASVENHDAGRPRASVENDAEPADEATEATVPVVAHSEPEDPKAELTDRERQILEFERQWWRHAGSKEQAIREQFGLSATRYYQVLNALLDSPAAVAYDPLVVGRLRRLRATRARTRSAR